MGNCNLAGYLTGYGIVKKDGTVKEVKFDKPIHNRIVKTGINQLLKYNGTKDKIYKTTLNNYERLPNAFALFIGNTGTHYGCLNFCRIGTSDKETDYFDTELAMEPIDDKKYIAQTSTLKTGTTYLNSKIINAYEYTTTITHDFGVINEDVDIKEIGYFGRYQDDPNDPTSIFYPMFSRIVLDTPIKIEYGEEFYCTYTLHIKIDESVEKIENFGNTGKHVLMKYNPYCPDTNILYDSKKPRTESKIPFPGIFSDGTYYYPYGGIRSEGGSMSSDYARKMRCFLFPHIIIDKRSWYDSNNGCAAKEDVYITTTPKKFDSTSNELSTEFISTMFTKNDQGRLSNPAQYIPVNYEDDTNYRDLKIKLPTYCPNLTTAEGNDKIEIHNIYCRGYEYKLGHYNEDGSEWIPEPIVKKVNQEMTFTIRTTITTDDTEEFYDETGRLKPEYTT